MSSDKSIFDKLKLGASNIQFKYDTFVQNSSWYAPMIETLKNFGILLPGRFSQDDISGEAFYSALSILSYYHDGILGKPRSHASELVLSGYPAHVSSPNDIGGEGKKGEESSERLLSWLNGILFILSSTECMIEIGAGQVFVQKNQAEFTKVFTNGSGNFFNMQARRKLTGRMQKFKWWVIICIEAAKFLIRMIALYKNRGKILLAPSEEAMGQGQLQRQSQAEVTQYYRFMQDHARDVKAKKSVTGEGICDLTKLMGRNSNKQGVEAGNKTPSKTPSHSSLSTISGLSGNPYNTSNSSLNRLSSNSDSESPDSPSDSASGATSSVNLACAKDVAQTILLSLPKPYIPSNTNSNTNSTNPKSPTSTSTGPATHNIDVDTDHPFLVPSPGSLYHSVRHQYVMRGRGVLPHGEMDSCVEQDIAQHNSLHQSIHLSQSPVSQSSDSSSSTSKPLCFPFPDDFIPPTERRSYSPPIRHIVSEVLYWMRPLLYVGAKLIAPSTRWTPLCLSALTDTLAFLLKPHSTDMSQKQREQWSNRTKLYSMYLLRSPLMNTVTLLPLHLLHMILGRLPVVGAVIDVFYAIARVIQQHYFYTAAS